MEEIKDFIKVELFLDKPYYDDLLWLCDQISEVEPSIVAEALLQVAIEQTVSSPEMVQEWLMAFHEDA